MAKKKAQSYRSIYISLAITIALAIYIFLSRSQVTEIAQKVDIFAVNEASITYGNTTMSGILLKDASVEKEGNFLLALPSNQVIILDIKNKNELIGQPVSVTGLLTPLSNSSSGYMKVTNITLLKNP